MHIRKEKQTDFLYVSHNFFAARLCRRSGHFRRDGGCASSGSRFGRIGGRLGGRLFCDGHSSCVRRESGGCNERFVRIRGRLGIDYSRGWRQKNSNGFERFVAV